MHTVKNHKGVPESCSGRPQLNIVHDADYVFRQDIHPQAEIPMGEEWFPRCLT